MKSCLFGVWLLCALTPFSALCGFRKIEDTLALFRTLSLPHVSFLLDILEELPNEAGLSITESNRPLIVASEQLLPMFSVV